MLRMVSHPHRPQSGHITCYLNRTYHVLPTERCLFLALTSKGMHRVGSRLGTAACKVFLYLPLVVAHRAGCLGLLNSKKKHSKEKYESNQEGSYTLPWASDPRDSSRIDQWRQPQSQHAAAADRGRDDNKCPSCGNQHPFAGDRLREHRPSDGQCRKPSGCTAKRHSRSELHEYS